MHLKFKDYVTLFQLARQRLISEGHYREFQKFQGQLLVQFLDACGISVHGARVADIACGYGGYSLALQEAGARVAGLDLSPQVLSERLLLVRADALSLPVKLDSFDIVVCVSLIEHVARPARLLEDLYRVARPGGVVYVGFPPFYSPRGGHHFSPFHYLGETLAVRLASHVGRWRKSAWVQENYPRALAPASYATAYGAWGIYPLTIRKFERLLQHTAFDVQKRSTRLLPIDVSGIPLLREVLTWHVQYILRKPRTTQGVENG